MDRRSVDPSVYKLYGRLKVADTAEMKQLVDARTTEVLVMDTNYMLACGIVWRKTADPDAGWELVEALASPDPDLRQFARDMLILRRENAMALLEDAVGAGVLTPEMAGPCMAELFRTGTCTSSHSSVTSEA